MKEVNTSTVAIVIGVIVVVLAGYGVYRWRSQPAIDPTSPEAMQSTQQMQQEYSGKSGMRPPPGTAGNPAQDGMMPPGKAYPVK